MCLCLYSTVYRSLYYVPVLIEHSLPVILCACAYIAQFTGHHIMCLCLYSTVYWSPYHVPVLSMPLVHGFEERGMGMAQW